MRSSYDLVWRNLSAHKLRSILTALAIALGVGMVLAGAIVGQAASQRAALLSGEQQVDLEVVSRDDAPFDGSVLDTLRAFPDVELVVPSLRVEAEGVQPAVSRVALLGIDPQLYQVLHEPKLADGTFLDGPDTIVLPMWVAVDHNLRSGDELTLKAGGGTVTLVVAGRLKAEQDITAFTESMVAYVPLSVAQTLSGTPGQIDHVEVRLRADADVDRARIALAGQLEAGLAVVRATTGGGISVSVYLVQIGLAMVGAIVLFAAAFVIMNAFAMSVTGRTQQIGAMRALGMTRRQVMQQVLAEAGLLGLAGGALGLLGGLGLAWGVVQAVGVGGEIPFAVPWWGVILSLLLGLGVTLVGALQPARRASRVSPLVAVRPQSTKSGTSWYVRYGGRVGGILLLILLPAMTGVALILRPDFYRSFVLLGMTQAGLLLATVLLLPALVHPIVSLCRPVLTRWLGTAGRLAADNLGRNRLRTVLTAGALTAVLTAFVATSGLMTASLKGGLRGYFSLFHEDGMLLPDIVSLLASGEMTVENTMERLTTKAVLDPRLVGAVEALAEKDIIEVERVGFAPVPGELSPIPGAPGVFVEPETFLPLGNFDFFEGDAETALAWMLRGRAVLLVPIIAERLGVGVGDVFPVETPHGRVDFTVAGVGGDGYNFVVFSYADGEAYFDLAGPSWLGIIVPEGQDVDQAMAQVRAAIEPFGGVTAGKLDPAVLEESWFKIVDRLQMLLDGLLFVAAVVAALGVVNTMVINVAERRREIGLFRAVGATRRQVRSAVVAEAALLGFAAALIATVLSLLMLALFALVFTPGGTASMGIRVSWEAAGWALPPALRDLGIAAALALTLGPAVAAVAAYLPARRAASMNVVEATRSERVTL